ncbi:hypothetical protein CRUP_007298 [Coryphaenoides rupestris]|nr:hypothetical protein CRUP_007298 [Coryphaenoides rupestris]
MADAVAKVARRVNDTVEEGKDSLDLSNCKLMNFPDGVFKVLKSVAENIHVVMLADNLDLHCNVLTKLPDAVADVEHLKNIDLANNSFSVFPEKLLEIPTLETINLEGNTITEIPVERLSAMPALKWINVKSNPLDKDTLAAVQTPHKCEILFTADA